MIGGLLPYLKWKLQQTGYTPAQNEKYYESRLYPYFSDEAKELAAEATWNPDTHCVTGAIDGETDDLLGGDAQIAQLVEIDNIEEVRPSATTQPSENANDSVSTFQPRAATAIAPSDDAAGDNSVSTMGTNTTQLSSNGIALRETQQQLSQILQRLNSGQVTSIEDVRQQLETAAITAATEARSSGVTQ